MIRSGKMLLTSVHLEAYENDGISGLSTADREENYRFLANLINRTAALGGTGSPWTASTVAPYSGSRHAYAMQPGASTPSHLERSFDLSAFAGGNLIYFRRLVGLDSADEFRAEYFHGTWVTLEATGSLSADDAAYVQKEFMLPRTATKLRFTCQAGAVSEKCQVDDVSLFGMQVRPHAAAGPQRMLRSGARTVAIASRVSKAEDCVMAIGKENEELARRFAGVLLVVGGVPAILVALDLIAYVDTRPNRVPIFNDPHSWQVFALGTAMTSLGLQLLLPPAMRLVAKLNGWVLGISAAAVLAGVILEKCF